ncbi:aldolase [Rhodococcus fascians]|nr:aldolase [Rhodococcus fascians]MBY4112907.1 aldolase [Rhodococcus fascians]
MTGHDDVVPPSAGGALTDDAFARIEALFEPIDADLAQHYPGDRIGGQPSHTVYVPASEASENIPAAWGTAALGLLDAHPEAFAGLGTTDALPVVRDRLNAAPIQDLRFDFEDGYGWRSDAVEDRHATAAGAALAALARDTAGPSWLGIRAKGLAAHERRRGIRTLELVLDGAGGVPDGFVFTVPKLRAVEQVSAVVALCDELERAHGLPDRALRFELQIESPQAVIGADGTTTLARAIARADGRCTSLHYGTYDYSAACGITSAQQSLAHPVADHAKNIMLVAAAQTGVWVCDGSTQVVPTGSSEQVAASARRHFDLVTRSLERGFYQGWDMHPGHLVTRWLATFEFFRHAMPVAAARLGNYLDRRGGDVMDEPATAQALAGVLVRGLDAGAFGVTELQDVAPSVDRNVLRGLLDRSVTVPLG